MAIIFVILVVATSCSFALYIIGTDNDNDFYSFIGAMAVLVSTISWFGYLTAIVLWIGAEHKVEILNKEYGTAYTQEQVFWASDVIDTVRQLDRKRIQVQAELQNKSLNVELMNPSCMR